MRPGVVLNRACIKGFFCPKLGQVSNPQRLTYYKTIITHLLFEYPAPLPWGKQNWHHFENREAPGKRRDPWNKKDHMTAISHEQKVTTTRLVRLCMLSRVLLRFIEGKEITTGHDKKTGSHLLLLFRRIISPFCVWTCPNLEMLLDTV